MVRLQRLHAPLRLLRGFVGSKYTLFCFSGIVFLRHDLKLNNVDLYPSFLGFRSKFIDNYLSTAFFLQLNCMIQHLGTLVTQPCPELRAPLCSFNCRSRVPYVLQVIHSSTMPLSRRKKSFRPFQNWLQNAAELKGRNIAGIWGGREACVLRATACNMSLDQQVCESSVHLLNNYLNA